MRILYNTSLLTETKTFLKYFNSWRTVSPYSHFFSSIWKKNSVAWVCGWTIPTERPPLVGEVSANFCGKRVPRGQHDRSLRPYYRFSRPEPLLFYQVAPQLYSQGWVGPILDSLLLRKSGSAGNRTQTTWICCHELWPLDHRGGPPVSDICKINFVCLPHSCLTLFRLSLFILLGSCNQCSLAVSFDLIILSILRWTIAYASSIHNSLEYFWMKVDNISNSFPSLYPQKVGNHFADKRRSLGGIVARGLRPWSLV
jgi:hypothetical protein